MDGGLRCCTQAPDSSSETRFASRSAGALTRSRSSSACRGRLPLAVGAAEPDPDPGSVLVLIGNSKGRLFRIAPDEEQRVGFPSGASWSYPGGVEVYAQASVAAAVRRTFVSHQNGGRSTRIRSRGAAEAVGALVVECPRWHVGLMLTTWSSELARRVWPSRTP